MTLFEIENQKHNLKFNIFVKLTANHKCKSVINSLISDWTQSITTNIVHCVLQKQIILFDNLSMVNGSQYHWNIYTPKLISILLFIELKYRIESTNGFSHLNCWKSSFQNGSYSVDTFDN